MSKKDWVEEMLPQPTRKIKHKIIICDNPNCEAVIIEDGKQLEKEHLQIGSIDGKRLLDFCSERCQKRFTKQVERTNQ